MITITIILYIHFKKKNDNDDVDVDVDDGWRIDYRRIEGFKIYLVVQFCFIMIRVDSSNILLSICIINTIIYSGPPRL